MIVQWCIKGLALPDDGQARAVIDNREGLACNWCVMLARSRPSSSDRS